MLDKDATTIDHLIYYQCSKIVAKSAFNVPDGMSAEGEDYGFIKKTLRELTSDTKQ